MIGLAEIFMAVMGLAGIGIFIASRVDARQRQREEEQDRRR